MSDALYIKKIKKANMDKAITRIAYHTQRARYHLDQISTQAIADDIELTRQGLQRRINVYKEAQNGK